MSHLLEEVLEAHGGLDRWQRFSRVEADAVTGGGLFPLKGLVPDLSTRRMSVWLKEERASVAPFGAADQRSPPNDWRSRSWTARSWRNGPFHGTLS
jgi:hypothetical protein